MANERKITVTFDGKDVGLGKASKDAGDDVERAGGRFKNVGGLLAGAFTGGTLAAAGGLFALGSAAATEEQSTAALATSMRNMTGATDETIGKVEESISAMQRATGVADDDLREAYTNLLGSTKDAGYSMDLLSVATDIAAAKHISAADAADILAAAGRGEMDAIEGLGVATEDAAGETLSFEQIMANAADTFNGQAATAADTTAGKFQILKTRLGEVGEDIGAKLLPVALRFGDWLTGTAIPKISEFANWIGPQLSPYIADLSSLFQDRLVPAAQSVFSGLSSIGTFISEHKEVFRDLAIGVGVALVVAFTAWAVSAAAAAAATIAATWPVLAIGAAIAVLVAGVIWAYQNWGWFRDTVDTVARVLKENVWPAIRTGIDWLGKFIGIVISVGAVVGRVIAAAARTFMDLNGDIVRLVSSALSVIGSIPGRVSGALSSLANAISAPFRAGFGAIKDAWNNTIGGKGFSLPGIPGITKGIDFKIPKLAGGGLAFGPTLAMVGDNAGAMRDPEVIAPLSKLRGMVGDGGDMVHVQVNVDGQTLFDVIRKGIRNRGGLQAALG